MLAIAVALIILGVSPRHRLALGDAAPNKRLVPIVCTVVAVIAALLIRRVSVIVAIVVLVGVGLRVGLVVRSVRTRTRTKENRARGVGQLAGTLRTGALYRPEDAPDEPRVVALGRVAQTYGVPLAGLLESVQATMDRELQHQKQTVAQLQGPITTAAILTALPIIGIVMGGALGADSIHYLLGGGTGGLVLVGGVVCIAAGIEWSVRIITGAM